MFNVLSGLNCSVVYAGSLGKRLSLSGIQLHINRLSCNFWFLPRDAMHPRYYSHGPVSVCPSQVGVLLKRLNVGSHK